MIPLVVASERGKAQTPVHNRGVVGLCGREGHGRRSGLGRPAEEGDSPVFGTKTQPGRAPEYGGTR